MANAGSDSIQYVSGKLQTQEDEMKAKLDDEASRILINAKIDPQFMALKEDL